MAVLRALSNACAVQPPPILHSTCLGSAVHVCLLLQQAPRHRHCFLLSRALALHESPEVRFTEQAATPLTSLLVQLPEDLSDDLPYALQRL